MSYVTKRKLYAVRLLEMLIDIRTIFFDPEHRYNGSNSAVEISLRGRKP